ncbi:MAG: choice-of-anchor D domain-containing protein, partial [Proteobacteria bacterium]|nr:choice-of-anchor D domain-containing protein [Pseudomonadota bacterium]
MKRWLIITSLVVAWLGWSSTSFAAITMSGGGADFGEVHFGNSSTLTKALIVPGPGPESYDSVTITAGTATTLAECTSQYSVTPTTGTVTSGGGQSLMVTFTPNARKTSNCVGTFKLAAATAGSFTLTGIGVAPVPQVTTAPLPVDFGTIRVAVGTPGTSTKTILFKNNGNADLEVTALSLPAGDYAFSSPPAVPFTIPFGTTQTFTVVFDPSASGTRTNTITISAHDPVTGTTPLADTTIGLTGVGGNARIHASNFNDTANLIDFGIAPNGTATHANVSIKNDAAAPKMALNLGSATITPATAGSTWFSFGTNGTFACAAGSQTCNFTQTVNSTAFLADVICNPNPTTQMDTQTATITFASDTDVTGAVNSVSLSCTGGRSNVTVTATTLAFGDQRVGTDSTVQSFNITNSGNIAASYNITKSGDAGEFVISNCAASGSVPALSGSVLCNVVFHPTSLGAKLATFSISTNDPDPGDATKLISASGNGVSPQIAGPASVDFGNIDIGSSSTAQMLTITNTGTQALQITSGNIQSGAAYMVMSGTTGAQTVAPAATATWMLVCTPTAQGANAGQFRIVSDSATMSTLNVPLTCNGQRGFFTANPPSIDFGPVPQGMMVERTFILQNTGNLAITGISAALTQTVGQGYSYDATTVPASLAPAASATVKVKFLPPDGAAGGAATFTVSGTWTGTAAHAIMIVVPLNGDGLSEGVDVSPMTGLDYGSFRWDAPKSLSFCVINNSQFAVNITDIAINPDAGTMMGEFTRTGMKRQTTCHTGGTVVGSLPLAVPLAANEILEVTITATPASRIGTLGATAVIMTDLSTNPSRMITMTGMATSGAIAVNPGMDIDLGPVDVDVGAVTQSITITNTGTADFDLTGFTVMNADPNIVLTLPGNTVLAPNAMVSIGVSYDPDLVANDAITLTHGIAHILGGPTSGTYQIHGRGIDRTFDADPLEVTFPMTFKNPGSKAPKQIIMVKNTGEAPLNVTATMVQGASEFTLVDTAGFVVPGNGSHPVEVTFTPTMVNAQSDATLVLTNDDDKKPMASIPLHGMGIGRQVLLDPMTEIDLGYTALGIPVTIGGFNITSMDPTNAFTIRAITLSGIDTPFSLVGGPTGTADPATVGDGVTLGPSATQEFQITFDPTEAGYAETTATVYLDEDPESQGTVRIKGT